ELIVARKDLPPGDLKEFIAYAKANAEKLNVAHGGVGGLLFTYAILLNSVLGVNPTMVPFTGGAPAANALVGGQVDYMVNGINEVGQQVQAGTIKAYAITAAELAATTRAIPAGKRRWPVILADPPWDFEVYAPDKQISHPAYHYPVMSLDAI